MKNKIKHKNGNYAIGKYNDIESHVHITLTIRRQENIQELIEKTESHYRKRGFEMMTISPRHISGLPLNRAGYLPENNYTKRISKW